MTVEPDSVALAVVLFAGCGAALFCMVRYRFWAVTVLAACVAVVLAMTAGLWAINDYTGYYTSWTTLADAIGGVTPPAPVVVAAASASGPVMVYPAPGTRTASPQTQLSIRGVAPGKIGSISVVGSRSGTHTGTLRADSDADGASFYPSRPFTAGETVTVHTHLSVAGASHGTYRFTVSRPVHEGGGARNENTDATQVQHFASNPSLQPPVVTVQAGHLTAADGDVFLAPKAGPGQDGPMIVSPDGQLVWFDPMPEGQWAYDFRVQDYEGQPVLTWWQGYTVNGHGQGEDVIVDDDYETIATVRAGNGYQADLHDFTITGSDTALITSYQPVRWNLTSVGGPADGVVLDSIAQEIDIPTGNVLAEWHALDHVPLTASYATPAAGQPYDFFHINSLDLAADGQLLISARATHTVYDVDLVTGRIRWRLGGKQSSFTGSGTDFSSQHDAEFDGPDRISLFNDAAGVGTPTATHSSGMIVDLDPARHTATTERSFSTDSVPRTDSQGDTQPLRDGGAFVGWGAQPYLSQFDASGQLVWQAKLPTGDQSYRAYRFAWSGHPTDRPAVSASSADGRTTVHVSWNGATDVASWQVSTGSSPSSLTAARTVTRSGFDTAISIAGTPSYVAVTALDADGHVLSTSSAVADSPTAPLPGLR